MAIEETLSSTGAGLQTTNPTSSISEFIVEFVTLGGEVSLQYRRDGGSWVTAKTLNNSGGHPVISPDTTVEYRFYMRDEGGCEANVYFGP